METKVELIWYADAVQHRGPVDDLVLWWASAYVIVTIAEGSALSDVDLEDSVRNFIGNGVDVDPDSLEIMSITWVLMDAATAPA